MPRIRRRCKALFGEMGENSVSKTDFRLPESTCIMENAGIHLLSRHCHGHYRACSAQKDEIHETVCVHLPNVLYCCRKPAAP